MGRTNKCPSQRGLFGEKFLCYAKELTLLSIELIESPRVVGVFELAGEWNVLVAARTIVKMQRAISTAADESEMGSDVEASCLTHGKFSLGL